MGAWRKRKAEIAAKVKAGEITAAEGSAQLKGFGGTLIAHEREQAETGIERCDRCGHLARIHEVRAGMQVCIGCEQLPGEWPCA